MNDRELVLNILRYGEFDRMPVLHWGGWDETLERWRQEGMPADANEHEFLGAKRHIQWIWTNVDLYPVFEEEVFEETDEYRVVRQPDGVIAKDWKHKSAIPHFLEYTLKGAEGWDEYKKRLQPHPGRIPANIEQIIAAAEASGSPVAVRAGAMFGWLRNWMGVENLAYLSYDDRDLLKEMVTTIADLVCWGLDQILPRAKVDILWGWEDICYRTGPLVTPDVFREVAVPGYQKIASKMREYGVEFYAVDSDGVVDSLIPHWIEGGVNITFPCEVGAWKGDAMALRKKFGKEMRIIGGIDKLEIAKGPAAIDAEIARRLPLMREGGYIPLPDHTIVPDTSLADYQYYLNAMRKLRF